MGKQNDYYEHARKSIQNGFFMQQGFYVLPLRNIFENIDSGYVCDNMEI